VSNPKPDRRGSDRASRLAYFLYGYRAPEGLNQDERRSALSAAIAKRFPEITDEELIRGYQIATELIRADTVETETETAKLKAELQRRRKADRLEEP
jgi:hypothetical protein